MDFHSKPNTYVRQVHLFVMDLNRSLQFYKDLLGFSVLHEQDYKVVLTADGSTPLITLEQPENILPKQPRRTGLYHFALLLPNRKELGKVILHLMQRRYPLQGASDHSVSEALYLADPDGHGIEIYRDRPADTWNWTNNEVFMDTRPLDVESILAEVQGEEWTGMPKETIMGHIHLHVADLKATEKFYIDGLGFNTVLRYGPQALFTSTGDYHHHIGLNIWNGADAPSPDEHTVRMGYFTIVFPSEEARLNAVQLLQAMNAYVEDKDHDYVTKDPSNIEIHLVL